MEDNCLLQRKFFLEILYKLEDDGVEVTETTFLESNKYKIPYESIPNSRQEIMLSKKYLFWSAVGLLLFDVYLVLTIFIYKGTNPATLLPFGFLAFVLIIFWYFSRRKYIVYSEGYGIAFYKTGYNDPELGNFIKCMLEKRDAYLMAKYSLPTNDFSVIYELDRIAFLFERELISEEEYLKLKSNLIAQTEPQLKDIGFKKNK